MLFCIQYVVRYLFEMPYFVCLEHSVCHGFLHCFLENFFFFMYLPASFLCKSRSLTQTGQDEKFEKAKK